MTEIRGLSASGAIVTHEIESAVAASAKARADARAASRPTRPLSGLDFLNRLTPQEYAAILSAAQQQMTAGQPQLSLWIDKFRVNGEIKLQSTDAQAAKTALVSAALLTQARADIIFG